MRSSKVTGLFFVFVGLLNINSFAKGLKIEGEGVTKTQPYVYLYETFGEELFLRDSAEIKKGEFTFKVDEESTPKGVYGVGYSMKEVVPVVLPVEDIVLKEEDGVLTLKESVESIEIKNYFLHLSSYDVSLRGIEKKYSQIVGLQQTDPEAFRNEFAFIRASLDSLNVDRTSYFTALESSSPAVFGKQIGRFFHSDSLTTKENFIVKSDFDNDEYTRGVILEKKINMYFMNYVSLSAQTLEKEFGILFNKAAKGSRGRQILYSTLIKISNAFNANYSKELYNSFKAEYPESEYVVRCKKLLPPSAPVIGDEAPDVELPNAAGELMKLSDLRGKVVLVDFWASWCGPCRREMPNVVAAYEKYKEKGFTVYSISLDGDKGRWQNAIAQDGMTWPYHVSELKKWDSQAARAYFVRGIPATFLLDENGVIVGTNLRGPALHKKLNELLSE